MRKLLHISIPVPRIIRRLINILLCCLWKARLPQRRQRVCDLVCLLLFVVRKGGFNQDVLKVSAKKRTQRTRYLSSDISPCINYLNNCWTHLSSKIYQVLNSRFSTLLNSHAKNVAITPQHPSIAHDKINASRHHPKLVASIHPLMMSIFSRSNLETFWT